MNNPARALSLLLCAVLAAACSQTPAPKAAAEAPKPTPSPTPGPTPAGRSMPTLYEALGGGKPPQVEPPGAEEEGAPARGADIVVDPVTGKRLLRIPKSGGWYERDGRLFVAMVPDKKGLPLFKKDADYFYVEAQPEPTAEEMAKKKVRDEAFAANLQNIEELPEEEAEVVKPGISKTAIRLEENSIGLPPSGIWRDNFDLGDLDGDGRPEIVAPPPRLSAQGIRIFKWTGDRWRSIDAVFDNPDNLHVAYGGVVVADLDGDGKNDIVWGGHGEGMWVAYNLGGFKFRISSQGLPRDISTRAMAVGDLDGDGRNDILVVSDMPEYAMSTGKPVLTPSGYLAGFDARAYLNGGGRFMELTAGLENTCYAYSVALSLPANADDGPPFYVSGCRYPGWVSNLKTFNRKTMKFEYAGYEIVERLSVSLGSAVGHYKGRRAAFVTYLKNTPGAYKPNVTGDGISIYYLDGETWKRKRVLKRIGDRATSQAIAVGDLNGDGLDDIVFADNLLNKLRVFFQTPGGEFEELDPSLEPAFTNAPSSIRIGDVDGDGRPDIVLMTHYLTEHTTKGGGLRFFRNLPAK